MGKLLIYCYSITFFEIIVIVSAIKKIVIATWSASERIFLHFFSTWSHWYINADINKKLIKNQFGK